MRHVINRRRLDRSLTALQSIRPSGGDPEHLVTAELVRRASDNKRYRLSLFQGCFEALLGLVDPDLEATATPLNAEAEAAPSCRQVWIDRYAVASQ